MSDEDDPFSSLEALLGGGGEDEQAEESESESESEPEVELSDGGEGACQAVHSAAAQLSVRRSLRLIGSFCAVSLATRGQMTHSQR